MPQNLLLAETSLCKINASTARYEEEGIKQGVCEGAMFQKFSNL
jgi:hypothetical protein